MNCKGLLWTTDPNALSTNLSMLVFPLQVALPIYLTQTRSKLLFTADFKAEGANFYERGVAIICSSL